MESQGHYNRCKNLLRKLIDEIALKYKEIVEPKEYEVKADSIT